MLSEIFFTALHLSILFISLFDWTVKKQGPIQRVAIEYPFYKLLEVNGLIRMMSHLKMLTPAAVELNGDQIACPEACRDSLGGRASTCAWTTCSRKSTRKTTAESVFAGARAVGDTSLPALSSPPSTPCCSSATVISSVSHLRHGTAAVSMCCFCSVGSLRI